jgi:endonuclease YncB( thermonuclease family)
MLRAWFRRALPVLCAFGLAGCVAETDTTAPKAQQAGGTGCRVTYVVDGDTIHMSCPGTGDVKARLLGFDTPEVYSPDCREELVAGRRATAVLTHLLRSGPITGAQFEGQDRYGRALVRLAVAGQDVARRMIASGYAVPYSGGRHPDWCGML